MEFKSKYKSKPVDENGFVKYEKIDDEIWNILYKRQVKLIKDRACDEFIKGIDLLGITAKEIPQLPDVNGKLQKLTGWSLQSVKALITPKEFFTLLANRQFPVATFIRTLDDLDYISEPDIFHEIFGHCPMLTNKVFADFMAKYAQFVLSKDDEDWPLLQRLFWFTVEFGLIQASDGIRAYGGGILSSKNETVYCIESDLPIRILFNTLVALRTPYRIDRMQPVYFVIESYQELYDILLTDMGGLLQRVRELGEFPAMFELDGDSQNIHISVC